ncbi:hypothetical protein OH764_31530 [Burkholderia sp. M6-3]
MEPAALAFQRITLFISRERRFVLESICLRVPKTAEGSIENPCGHIANFGYRHCWQEWRSALRPKKQQIYGNAVLSGDLQSWNRGIQNVEAGMRMRLKHDPTGGCYLKAAKIYALKRKAKARVKRKQVCLGVAKKRSARKKARTYAFEALSAFPRFIHAGVVREHSCYLHLWLRTTTRAY